MKLLKKYWWRKAGQDANVEINYYIIVLILEFNGSKNDNKSINLKMESYLFQG